MTFWGHRVLRQGEIEATMYKSQSLVPATPREYLENIGLLCPRTSLAEHPPSSGLDSMCF